MAEEITTSQFYFSSSFFFFFFPKVDENHGPVGKFNVFFCVFFLCVRLCISSCIIDREHHSFYVTIFGNLTKNGIFCVCASLYLSEREREKKNENIASNFLLCRNALFNIPQKQYP